MFRCLTDVGIPAGVINLIHGPASEITEAVVTDERVRVVSFTGSTGVGKQIMKLAAANITRPLLELGGDAPFIVFDDADVEAAVEGAMAAKFRNTGQSCIGANRFYVHDSVMEEFSTKLAERVSNMTVGDGLADPTPDLGPCIDENRVQDLQALLDEALSGGARMLNHPVTVPAEGAYFAPVVLTDIPAESALSNEEIFGPIAAIYPFTDQDDVYALANDTQMGLAGYVYTNDLNRTWTAAERLEVGVLGINEPLPTVSFAPMGGIKQSGIGREGATIGLEEFQEICYVATTLSA
jgi:succinate-semialdehyde dehydrogenase/glutarate-semialdehyde dehydrogenase